MKLATISSSSLLIIAALGIAAHPIKGEWAVTEINGNNLSVPTTHPHFLLTRVEVLGSLSLIEQKISAQTAGLQQKNLLNIIEYLNKIITSSANLSTETHDIEQAHANFKIYWTDFRQIALQMGFAEAFLSALEQTEMNYAASSINVVTASTKNVMTKGTNFSKNIMHSLANTYQNLSTNPWAVKCLFVLSLLMLTFSIGLIIRSLRKIQQMRQIIKTTHHTAAILQQAKASVVPESILPYQYTRAQ